MFCFSRANHASTNLKTFSSFSRLLCIPSTSRVCITVSNSPNPSRVYIRLCKRGKRFLLLNYLYSKYKFKVVFNTSSKPFPLSEKPFTAFAKLGYEKRDFTKAEGRKTKNGERDTRREGQKVYLCQESRTAFIIITIIIIDHHVSSRQLRRIRPQERRYLAKEAENTGELA